MDLKTWLNEERGRYKALAEHLSVSQGRVTQMADDGVPVKYMAVVRDFTHGAVTLEELVSAKTSSTEEA